MNDPENEILISAYLDGELTAAEKSRVEQLLINDAEARQLLDELRAIRTRLQALPLHHLAPDFAQQVLNLAQREVAPNQTDNQTSPAHLLTRSPVHPAPTDSPSSNRRIPIFASRRSIFWSVATIAAAVVIVVTTRQNPPQRELAQNVERQPAAAEKPDRSSPLELNGQVAANRNEMAKEPTGHAELNSPTGSVSGPQPSPATVANSNDREEAFAPSMTPAEKPKSDSEAELRPSFDAAQASAAAPSAAPSVTAGPLVAGNSPSQAVQTPDHHYQQRLAAPSQQSSEPSQPSVSAIAGLELKSPQAPPAAGVAAGLDQIQKSAVAPSEDGVAEESLVHQVTSGDGDVLVIHVAVSPEAARRGAFEQLLASNRITLADDESDSAAQTPKLKSELAGGGQNADRYMADQPATNRKDVSDDLTAEADKTKNFAFKMTDRAKDMKSPVSNASAGDVEAIYVEASPGQIARTLTALHNNATEFPSIAGTITRGPLPHDGAISGLQREQNEQRAASAQSQAAPILLHEEKQASATPQAAAPALSAQGKSAELDGKSSVASGQPSVSGAGGFGGGSAGGELTLGGRFGANGETEGRARRLFIPLSGKNTETLGIASNKPQVDSQLVRDKSDRSLSDADGAKHGDWNMQLDSSRLNTETAAAPETSKKLAIDRRRSAGEEGSLADELATAQPRRALFLLRIVNSPTVANPAQTNGSDTGRPSTPATTPPAKSD